MNWLAQYFLNPGFVLPGLALASLPILIHILSRMRYRRVRFAAMEFLLQSDEMNRRRLILEQLLLLLLRVLAVLLLVFLVARFVLDPSRLLILGGASVHHVVILDDTLSLRDRVDGDLAFDRAISTMEQMLAQGGESATSARVSILRMTDPQRPIVSDRKLNTAFLQEITPLLRNLTCSYRSASPALALEVARDMLADETGVTPQVHVLTDLRQSDWTGRPELTTALEGLKAIKAEVTIVQLIEDAHANVSIEQLTADSLTIARGVPWRIHLRVRNHGNAVTEGLRGTIRIDGNALPTSLLIPDIEPQKSVDISHDLLLNTEGRHQIEVVLDEDALPEDSRRFIAVDVTDRRRILIVDDEPVQEDAGFVSAAVSADPDLTGIVTELRTSQVIASADLAAYDVVYLLNVRDLPADATLALMEYVTAGGGLVWFPGETAALEWYNGTLRSVETPLFPVPLSTLTGMAGSTGGAGSGTGSRSNATGNSGESSGLQSLVFEQHPVFDVYNLPDSPFDDVIQMSRWYQTADNWEKNDTRRADGVKTLARTSGTGDPVIFEHRVGAGRVMTFLTGAGRRWSNWPIAPAAPGYVVMHLLMQPYLQRPSDLIQQSEIDAPLRWSWPMSQFQDTVEVYLPEPESTDDQAADTFVRLQAGFVATTDGASSPGDLTTPADPDSENRGGVDTGTEPEFEVRIDQAQRPGVYRIRRFTPEGNSRDTLIAMNPPITESGLSLADPALITQQGKFDHVRILDANAAASLGGGDKGRELRWVILGVLIAVLVAEQLMSLRMSFHPEATP